MLLPKSTHSQTLQLPRAQNPSNWTLAALQTHFRRALRRVDGLMADGGAPRDVRLMNVSSPGDLAGPRGPVVIWRMPLRAHMGEAVHVLDRTVASALVDALLGSPAVDGAPPRLTALDCAILGDWTAQLAGQLLGPLLDPGARGAPHVGHAETWCRRAAGEDGVAVILELRAGGLCGPLIILLPAQAALRLAASSTRPHRPAEAMAKRLSGGRVDVQARLITTTLSLAEVASLQEGDVLVLDLAPGDGAELLVNGSEKFTGKAGFMDGRIAFQISSRAGPGPGMQGRKAVK